jgi:hypothetical protein
MSGSSPLNGQPLISRKITVSRKAVRLDDRLLKQRRVDVGVAEASLWSGKCRGGKTDVWKALDLLGCNSQDLRGDLAKVPELRVNDRHGLYLPRRRSVSLCSLATRRIRSARSSSVPGNPYLSSGFFGSDVGVFVLVSVFDLAELILSS